MKKELSGPTITAILTMFVVVVVSLGWYWINRPSPTVANNEKVQRNGNRGAYSPPGNVAPLARMPDNP